jgi:hypothetical protein
MIDYEQLAQESAIFPWLDSDCISDGFLDEEQFFFMAPDTNFQIDED